MTELDVSRQENPRRLGETFKKILFGPNKTERLQRTWEAQKDRLVKLGYHSALGLSAQEYVASLPKPEPQLTEFKGKFDRPLLVDPRVPIEKQLDLLGIKAGRLLGHNLKTLLENVRQEDDTQKISNEPYQIWTQMHPRTKTWRAIDTGTEASLTIIEALAYIREFPDKFRESPLKDVGLRIAFPDINSYSFCLQKISFTKFPYKN